MNVLSHFLIFFFIMWLLEGSLVVPPVFTDHIFLHLISCFCQVHVLILFPYISIGTKRYCKENSLWNWNGTVIQVGGPSHFSVEIGKVQIGTGLQHLLCPPYPLKFWIMQHRGLKKPKTYRKYVIKSVTNFLIGKASFYNIHCSWWLFPEQIWQRYISSNKPLNEKDAGNRFSFVEVEVDQYTEFFMDCPKVNKTKFNLSIAQNAF